MIAYKGKNFATASIARLVRFIMLCSRYAAAPFTAFSWLMRVES